MPKTYNVEVECNNCGRVGVLVIVSGKPVSNMPCPVCNNKTLHAVKGSAWKKG